MKVLTELVSGFGPALAVGYPSLTGLVSANNRFVQDNMEAVTVSDDFTATVDYSKIICSAGRLKAPKVSVAYEQAGNQLVFTQSVQQQTLTCNAEDVAWMVVYEKVQHEAEIYELYTRKEGGEVKAELPEDWEIANCEFYAFARNSNGTQASRTSYLQIPTV